MNIVMFDWKRTNLEFGSMQKNKVKNNKTFGTFFCALLVLFPFLPLYFYILFIVI